MVGIAAVLLAVDFSISKKYQMAETAGITAGMKFNACNGLFTAVLFFGIGGIKIGFSLFSAVLAFLMSLCGLAYSLLGFKILNKGNMATYSLFLMSGGMLLPYIFGVAFLDEKLSVLRIVGLLLILSAILVSSNIKVSVSRIVLALCIGVFVLNGCVSIISKCHQIDTSHNTVSSAHFVMLSGIFRFILSAVTLFFCKKKEEKITFSSNKSVLLIILSALVGGLSYMLQLIGAVNLPATVLYPLVTGGSIIFSALAGAVFFKEKISKNQMVSILLCFIGTFLFL